MAEFPARRTFVVPLFVAAVLAALAFPARAQDEGDEDDPRDLDGPALYRERCASCHGETGDGRGPLTLALGQPARSFADGGFAFGNTPEAMFRTVSSGVPGRSPMPGFRDVLSEDERWRVVEYVRTLMPKEAIAEPGVTLLRVPKDRPAIARGPLPPIAEGQPVRPRGLLVGLPEGLTFEYRIDDLRLLAVRQGDFVDRVDWNGRGGDFLKPLGAPFYAFAKGDPPPPYSLASAGASVPLSARLRSTTARPGVARLAFDLVAPNGKTIACAEELFAEVLSTGPAFRRRFIVWDGVPGVTVTVAGGGGAEKEVAEIADADGRHKWIVLERAGGGFECVRVACGDAPIVRDAGAIRLTVPVAGPEAEFGDVPAAEATTVLVPSYSLEILSSLSKEIDR